MNSSSVGPTRTDTGASFEDDPVNQLVVFELLGKLGCEVDVVDDGEAAHRAVGAGSYDIVFMDCHMPRDGRVRGHAPHPRLGAARRRRTGHRRADCGFAGHDRQRCLDAGMNDFLTEPVSSSQLSATIERWTDGAPRRHIGSAVVGA